MSYLTKYLPYSEDDSKMTKFATIFLILFGTYYYPLEPNVGFGIIKISLLAISIYLLIVNNFVFSKALFFGLIYLSYQAFQSLCFPEYFRWSSFLFSCALVLTYVNYYNMLYYREIFTLSSFIRLLKWMMLLFFIFCILQQIAIIVGLRVFPLINLMIFLNRGIGCNSLGLEPSNFARILFVLYYAYVKCIEFEKDEGPITLKELFQGKNKWVSIRFLWMMTTMGSGTAFVCLLLFSLYFVRRSNFYYMIPLFILMYFYVLPAFDVDQLDRAVNAANSFSKLDSELVTQTDGSAATRLMPILNSLSADFSNYKTWFGYGPGYATEHNLILSLKATLFDDYGFIFYIISLIFNFTCGYRFWSLATIFMFAGVAGGSGTNIPYSWFLFMLMSTIRYFYEKHTDIETEEFNEEIQ